MPPALGAWSPNHWTPQESPGSWLYRFHKSLFLILSFFSSSLPLSFNTSRSIYSFLSIDPPPSLIPGPPLPPALSPLSVPSSLIHLPHKVREKCSLPCAKPFHGSPGPWRQSPGSCLWPMRPCRAGPSLISLFYSSNPAYLLCARHHPCNGDMACPLNTSLFYLRTFAHTFPQHSSTSWPLLTFLISASM